MATGEMRLVGRERERDALRALLDAAVAGSGGLALIGGEAGIGKTALAEALCREATERGARVLVGCCYDLTETPPYGPWVELFSRYQPGADSPPLPDAFAVRGTVGAVASQDALFRQTLEFFTTLAASRPVVLLLDDLHWADPASLDLLRFLARNLAALPLLGIATYRSDELTRRLPLYPLLPLLVREAHAKRIDLQALNAGAVRALVEARYALPEEDTKRLVAYLEERAEGNALFLGEVLHSLEEGSLLAIAGERWSLGDLTNTAVPPLLRQVIDARVARFDAESQRLLMMAAVVGQEIPLDVWAAVADVDEDTLLDVAERAEAARIVEEMEDGAGVRFVHALIREALYEGVSAMRRRRLHAKIGEALIATGVPDPDAVVSHFRRAGDARLAEWLIKAGERAQRAFAEVSAIARFDEALSLLESTGPSRAKYTLLHNLAGLRRWRHEGVAYAEEAVAVARDLGDPFLEAEALLRVGTYRTFAEDLAAGLAEQERAVAMLAALPETDAHWFTAYRAQFSRSITATVLGYLAMTLALLGRLADAAAHLKAQDVGVTATAGRTMCAAMRGHPVEAHAAVQRGLEHLEARGDRRNAGALLAYEFITVLIPYHADNAADVRRVAEAATGAWAQVGEEAVGFPPRAIALEALVLHGQWEQAWSVLPVIRRYLRSAVSGVMNGSFIGALPLARGASQLATDLIDEVFPHGPATAPGTVPFRVALGLQETAVALCLDGGDAAGARIWLEAHDRWLGWNDAVLGQSEGQALWARYYRQAGNHDKAREHAERALAHATEPRQPLALLAAHRLLGELDTEAGQYEDAARHLDEALRLAEACEAPYERALTLLALAELHAAKSEPEQARALLDAVRAICQPLGAKPALARADALAARLTTAPPAAPSYPAGLSAREVEVLRFVAQGLTNVQIAERLFLSPRTVEQHLRSVYNKLGVATRAAATAFAFQHGLA